MGGLLNRRVDSPDDDGKPLVLGFVAVGDAHTCTNPLYGRGCSLAMVQATLLAEAVADHPGADPQVLEQRALAYEQGVEREVLPWYRAAVNQDRLNRQAAVARDQQRRAETGPVSVPPDVDGAEAAADDAEQEAAQQARDFMQSLMRDGLMVAVRTDASVFRAFVRSFNLLDPPELIMNDPDVMNRVLAAYQTRDERPRSRRWARNGPICSRCWPGPTDAGHDLVQTDTWSADAQGDERRYPEERVTGRSTTTSGRSSGVLSPRGPCAGSAAGRLSRRPIAGSAARDGLHDRQGAPVGHGRVEPVEEAHVVVVHEQVHVAHQRTLVVEQLVLEARVGGLERGQHLGHGGAVGVDLRRPGRQGAEHGGHTNGHTHGRQRIRNYCCNMMASNSARGLRAGRPVTSTTAWWMTPAYRNGAR